MTSTRIIHTASPARGLDTEAAHSEFSSLQGLDRWRELSAARAGRLYAVDSGVLFSRAGPRLVDGIELLGQLIHPDVFPGPPDPQYGKVLATKRHQQAVDHLPTLLAA